MDLYCGQYLVKNPGGTKSVKGFVYRHPITGDSLFGVRSSSTASAIKAEVTHILTGSVLAILPPGEKNPRGGRGMNPVDASCRFVKGLLGLRISNFSRKPTLAARPYAVPAPNYWASIHPGDKLQTPETKLRVDAVLDRIYKGHWWRSSGESQILKALEHPVVQYALTAYRYPITVEGMRQMLRTRETVCINPACDHAHLLHPHSRSLSCPICHFPEPSLYTLERLVVLVAPLSHPSFPASTLDSFFKPLASPLE